MNGSAIDGMVNGRMSHWLSDVPHVPRPELPGDIDADVCIIGGGFTGLWTAYYLKEAMPGLSVVVVEAVRCGFGASGRNGGWVSAVFVGSPRTFGRRAGASGVRDFQRALVDAVAEVADIVALEGIEADLVRPGYLRVARNPAQLERLSRDARQSWQLGLSEDECRLLSASEVRARVNIPSAQGGLVSDACARIQPAKLVEGLASAIERRGVEIFEQTPVTSYCPGTATTSHGTVRARYILRCTEGYTPTLPGLRRAVLPMNSSMLVTEPLDQQRWDAIGWSGEELLQDLAHLFFYAQRTADGRIAIGGRGVPYKYGSRWDQSGETPVRAVNQLASVLKRLFPQAGPLPLAHAWSGNLGVPRDWCPSVSLDPTTGLGHAGGYSGHGVAATNLAARTLRDLVLDSDSPLVRLPWVNHRSPRWEPEPIRWMAVRTLYFLYGLADRHEQSSGAPRTSVVARAADKLTGRPA